MLTREVQAMLGKYKSLPGHRREPQQRMQDAAGRC